MKQVFVLGSMNMDFIYKMDQIPKVGESLFVDDFITLPGGYLLESTDFVCYLLTLHNSLLVFAIRSE